MCLRMRPGCLESNTYPLLVVFLVSNLSSIDYGFGSLFNTLDEIALHEALGLQRRVGSYEGEIWRRHWKGEEEIVRFKIDLWYAWSGNLNSTSLPAITENSSSKHWLFSNKDCNHKNSSIISSAWSLMQKSGTRDIGSPSFCHSSTQIYNSCGLWSGAGQRLIFQGARTITDVRAR